MNDIVIPDAVAMIIFWSLAGTALGIALAFMTGIRGLVTGGLVSGFIAGVSVAWLMQHKAAIAQTTPEASHVVTPSIDYRGISEIISASHHNMPLIVVGATVIAIVAILAKALVRVVEINAQRQQPHYEQPQKRLEGPREEHRGNLPAKTDWR